MDIKLINVNHSLNAIFHTGIVGIVGANGCGKSTLLRTLGGLNAPLYGQVYIQQFDIYRFLNKAKSLIGYVASIPFLYGHLTINENLKFICKLRKIPKNQHPDRITHTLRQVSLIDYKDVLFSTLSDGLKKRACIASALLHAPSFLFLDEPCTGLDPKQREYLWELFKRLKEEGKSVVFSSHHVQEIEKICDDIYVLADRKLSLLTKEKEILKSYAL